MIIYSVNRTRYSKSLKKVNVYRTILHFSPDVRDCIAQGIILSSRYKKEYFLSKTTYDDLTLEGVSVKALGRFNDGKYIHIVRVSHSDTLSPVLESPS